MAKKAKSKSPKRSPSPYCGRKGAGKVGKITRSPKTRPLSSWTRFLREYYCQKKGGNASYRYGDAMEDCGKIWPQAKKALFDGRKPTADEIKSYISSKL